MDISIKNLKTYVFEPKTEAVKLARANEVTTMDSITTEKVDGTKLTLVRTNETSPNYEKNWIVAYKGSILYASEFAHLSKDDRDKISKSSIGISQYALVFQHLKKINHTIHEIPKQYEFSVEFAQNKDTLTRTYLQKGGMYLRSYGRVEHRIIGGHIFTHVIGHEETEHEKLKSMAGLLDISTFPIFYEGKINQDDIHVGNPSLYNRMVELGTKWNNPLDVVDKFSTAILEVPSTLGGKTEGVVMKFSNGSFFKVVQSDQYDADTRSQKKDKYGMENDKITEYFRKIRFIVRSILEDINVSEISEEEALKKANVELAKVSDDDLPRHEKKTALQVRDDVHDTLRLLISKGKLIGENVQTLGLVPIAGKPLHIGHWKLILKASEENDRVIVYTSEKDRIKNGEFPIYGRDFVKFWSDYFIPNLPNNVKVRIVDSPVRAVGHELQWLEQRAVQDRIYSPVVSVYSDTEDINNYSDSEIQTKYPILHRLHKIKFIGVDRNDTVNISGTKMREFLSKGDKKSFLNYLPPISFSEKEKIWDTLISKTPKEEPKKNPMKEFITELINSVFADMLNESGASTAMVDPKTSKTVDGQEARASTKLSIVDKNGKDIHGQVSDDIKEMVVALNNKIGFWNKNNPYIHNGHIFNGSSQFLMDPEKRGKLVGVKNTFGDVDVIIPKEKLDTLEAHLDSIDDNKSEWKKTPKNTVTPKFQYVGRTKSYASIPDQLVTLWYYQPTGQVVQVDFEGDEMTKDSKGFEKPSEWTKFTKDSPWDDLQVGIKGLAGALMLRALARGTSRLDNAVVLTNRGQKNVAAGAKELKDSDISFNAQHTMPSKYTLNTGGGGTGIRQAYKFVKSLPYEGKLVNAYRFVEAKETTPEERINDVGQIFKVIFNRAPTAEEKAQFRSFQGQLRMMKKYLPKDQVDLAMQRFTEILAGEPLSEKERGSIANAVKTILGRQI